MSGRRTGTAVAAIALVGMLATPLSVGAQTGDITFPPGLWEGSVFLGGSITTEGFRADDTHYISRRTVTLSDITFDVAVDAQGQITGGTMTVDIRWSDDGRGTTPVTLDAYHVTSEHRQAGTLTMGGTANRLVAAGSLTWEKFVYDTDGNYIEEVSGVRVDDVEWVFQASEGSCGMATGRLIGVTGMGLMMASALLPFHVSGSSSEIRNELVSVFRIWSADANVDVEGLTQLVEDLNDLANQLLADPAPTPITLATVVQLAEQLRAELARLEQCELVPVGFLVPESGEDWLAAILQSLLFKALEHPDYWNVQELIYMLNIGVRGGAVDTLGSDPTAAELYEAFGDALELALGEAIASSDLATINDIAAAAARYGYSGLYEAAMAFIAGQP